MSRIPSVAAVACTALAGCTSLLGIEAPVEAVDAAPDANHYACTSDEPFVDAVSFDTTSTDDTFTLTCGSEGSNDTAFRFDAPATDYYVFSTTGSSFDTVLALVDQCGAAELACSQNTGEATFSEIVSKLEKDQSVVLIVDGFAGARGAGELVAERVACPAQDLEGQSFPLPLATGAASTIATACRKPLIGEPPPTPGHDASYHWVAPEDGLWSFQVTSSDFEPVLSLRRGPRCTDEILTCGQGDAARVVRRLTQGEVVSIVVDSATADAGGNFQLDVQHRTGTCPGANIDAEVDVEHGAVATLGATPLLASSCGPSQLVNQGGEVVPMGDAVFRVVTPSAPDAAGVSCSVRGGSDVPFVLSAMAGDECAGIETACRASTAQGGDPNVQEASITLKGNPDAAVPYTVVVAQNGLAKPTVSLTTSCFISQF